MRIRSIIGRAARLVCMGQDHRTLALGSWSQARSREGPAGANDSERLAGPAPVVGVSLFRMYQARSTVRGIVGRAGSVDP